MIWVCKASTRCVYPAQVQPARSSKPPGTCRYIVPAIQSTNTKQKHDWLPHAAFTPKKGAFGAFCGPRNKYPVPSSHAFICIFLAPSTPVSRTTVADQVRPSPHPPFLFCYLVMLDHRMVQRACLLGHGRAINTIPTVCPKSRCRFRAP